MVTDEDEMEARYERWAEPFVYMFIPEDDPARIEFEAASARIHAGPGVHTDPFCQDCRIIRFPLKVTERTKRGWPLRMLQREQCIKCAKHYRIEE